MQQEESVHRLTQTGLTFSLSRDQLNIHFKLPCSLGNKNSMPCHQMVIYNVSEFKAATRLPAHGGKYPSESFIYTSAVEIYRIPLAFQLFTQAPALYYSYSQRHHCSQFLIVTCILPLESKALSHCSWATENQEGYQAHLPINISIVATYILDIFSIPVFLLGRKTQFQLMVGHCPLGTGLGGPGHKTIFISNHKLGTTPDSAGSWPYPVLLLRFECFKLFCIQKSIFHVFFFNINMFSLKKRVNLLGLRVKRRRFRKSNTDISVHCLLHQQSKLGKPWPAHIQTASYV